MPPTCRVACPRCWDIFTVVARSPYQLSILLYLTRGPDGDFSPASCTCCPSQQPLTKRAWRCPRGYVGSWHKLRRLGLLPAMPILPPSELSRVYVRLPLSALNPVPRTEISWRHHPSVLRRTSLWLTSTHFTNASSSRVRQECVCTVCSDPATGRTPPRRPLI
jgi:hypothetical protein